MTETHEQRVERLARAAYEGATNWCAENDHGEQDPYEGQLADFCRALARAIIASDRAAGYVTVPREPTKAMVEAHIVECAGDADEADEARVRDCWAAMIEAANSQGILDNSAAIAADRAAGYVTVPVDLLKDCADDLEAWVRFAYPEESRKYPSEARRYVRDMEPVRRLRAAIAAHEQEERHDAP